MALSTMSTQIVGPDRQIDLSQQSILAFVGRDFAGGWTGRIAAGALIGGAFDGAAGAAGWIGGVSLGRTFLAATGNWPFVTGSAAIAVSHRALSGNFRLLAGDVRIGTEVGWQLGPLAVYAIGRLFGGPVIWDGPGPSGVGGDRAHFQLGGGLQARIGSRFSIFAEFIPLGEKGGSAGCALRL